MASITAMVLHFPVLHFPVQATYGVRVDGDRETLPGVTITSSSTALPHVQLFDELLVALRASH